MYWFNKKKIKGKLFKSSPLASLPSINILVSVNFFEGRLRNLSRELVRQRVEHTHNISKAKIGNIID